MEKFVDSLSSVASRMVEETKAAIDTLDPEDVFRDQCGETFYETKRAAGQSLEEAKKIIITAAQDITASLPGAQDNAIEYQEAESSEADEIRDSISKLKGKDRVGVVGEGLAASGGALAGTAAAGTIASAAGATTIFGSSALAGVFGGVFVTATPVGWVIGSAVLAGAAGYGIAKIIRSGSTQDIVRKELIEKLNKKLSGLIEEERDNSDALVELNQIITLCIAAEILTNEKAEKLVELVEDGKLSPELALERTKAMAISAGVIEIVG